MAGRAAGAAKMSRALSAGRECPRGHFTWRGICETRRMEGIDYIGDYRVVRRLGTGGMGEVFLVDHPRLPRQDALKLLDSVVCRDKAFRARFIREAELLASLRHANIITVYDRGDCEGKLWLTMEYVEGRDAGRLLRTRHTFALDLTIEIVGGAGAALDYAYREHRITHRDVKPPNILVQFRHRDNQPAAIKLADFGIAKVAGELTSLTGPGATLGTVPYMSPEAVEGRVLDNRADIYSLACTAFEFLTGTRPFSGSSAAAHIIQAPPTITSVQPRLPVYLNGVFERALAKDPEARFQSCEQFVEALSGPCALLTPSAAAPNDPSTNTWPSSAPPFALNTPAAAWTRPAAKHIDDEPRRAAPPITSGNTRNVAHSNGRLRSNVSRELKFKIFGVALLLFGLGTAVYGGQMQKSGDSSGVSVVHDGAGFAVVGGLILVVELLIRRL